MYMYMYSLGTGSCIKLKAGAELLRRLWGAMTQWLGHLQLKQEALGSIPGAALGFSSSSWFINVDGMKDLS